MMYLPELFDCYIYQPLRIAFLRYQIRHTDKTLQIERSRKQCILESIAYDERVLANLKNELMQLERNRA